LGGLTGVKVRIGSKRKRGKVKKQKTKKKNHFAKER